MHCRSAYSSTRNSRRVLNQFVIVEKERRRIVAIIPVPAGSTCRARRWGTGSCRAAHCAAPARS